jgi:hypothetical protein
MKESKSIRICIDNIVIGTQIEEETLYAVNNNSPLKTNVITATIRALFLFCVSILSVFKRILLFVFNAIQHLL